VRHGFAERRVITTKAEVYAKKQAFVQAEQWFEEHLVDEEQGGTVMSKGSVDTWFPLT